MPPPAREMTNSELIKQLLDHPLDSKVYIGKGMGPLRTVDSQITDRIYIILAP